MRRFQLTEQLTKLKAQGLGYLTRPRQVKLLATLVLVLFLAPFLKAGYKHHQERTAPELSSVTAEVLHSELECYMAEALDRSGEQTTSTISGSELLEAPVKDLYVTTTSSAMASSETTSTAAPTAYYLTGLQPMSPEEYRIYNLAASTLLGASAAAGSSYYHAGWCTWFVYNARRNAGLACSTNFGHAKSWAQNARAQGYEVNNLPAVGAIACPPNMNHVMFVERVYADGSLLISEGGVGWVAYNYQRRYIPAYQAATYLFIH